MSTPTKKKAVAKPVEQKAKFSIGSKCFFIDRQRSKTGEVLQAKVTEVTQQRHVSKGINSPDSIVTTFEYSLFTAFGEYEGIYEFELFPTFTAVANYFATPHTHLLK
jgi:hypothetical protein